MERRTINMNNSKTICAKYHFCQVGHGGKKTNGGVFLTIFSNNENHELL